MTYAKTKPPLRAIYPLLFRSWGPQHWWPARSRFEMIIGAILTQNTAWTNVERALVNLRRARALTPEAMHALPAPDLAAHIRPAGYFNVKAIRLKSFVQWLMLHHGGSLNKMFQQSTTALRHDLLAIHGIGNETADSILLYAGRRPVFVVDAYTRRFLFRHGWINEKTGYDAVAEMFEQQHKDLPEGEKIAIYNEYHALIVALAKNHCRSKPDCVHCPLNKWPVLWTSKPDTI